MTRACLPSCAMDHRDLPSCIIGAVDEESQLLPQPQEQGCA